MVSIAAFQAVDPGSIPGRRKFIFLLFFRNNFLVRTFQMLNTCFNNFLKIPHTKVSIKGISFEVEFMMGPNID